MKVVGIMLVHNEDLLLARAAANALDFCDQLLIAEHKSTDGTWEIATDLARRHAKVEAVRIRDPRESSEMLQPYAGTATWVHGVDGDEIYDPAGLARVRATLESGAWNSWWVVFGNVLNCIEIDQAQKTARGYLAPPCRSMTKLYNFAAVQSLDPDSPQRLMGRNNVFVPGYSAGLRYEIYKSVTWDEADFRCLHACFLPRSSRQTENNRMRENITELNRFAPLAWLRRHWSQLRGGEAESHYKKEKYMRGEVVSVDASPFFP